MIGNHAMNKMKIYLHMFGAGVEDKVGGKVCSSNVITPKKGRFGHGDANLM
jgi:hypothetical protein